MIYKSLYNSNHLVSFETAMIEGLAPDKGLYVPSYIPKINNNLIKNINKYSNVEIAYNIIKKFIKNDIYDKKTLIEILNKTIHFDFPLINIEKNIFSFELFHGPTMAFKDIGTKFMAEILEKYIIKQNKEITVIVATSGDTGGAVAHGFYKKQGINVIILYPRNMISKIQKNQINSLGNNIKSIEIKGDFDDCQKIVKKLFIDQEIKKKLNITSANSINIARWIPQIFYYFYIYKKLTNLHIIDQKINISVPSGNFGNICAGVLSKLLGLPINHFIASTNINDTIPRFLKNNKYEPKKTIQTISNAMDISNPSNFKRILYLFKNNINKLKKHFYSYSFNDQETIDIINKIYIKNKYILDPHGAVSLLGLYKHIKKNNKKTINVFLETAHPIKFLNIFPKYLQNKINKPKQIKTLSSKQSTIILPNKYYDIKNWILNQ